jgi:hypothetical protein
MWGVRPSGKLLVIRYLLFELGNDAFEGDVKQRITIKDKQITVKIQEAK